MHDSPSVCYKPFSRRLIGHTSRLWRHSDTTPGCFQLSSTNVNYRGRVCLLSITGKPNPTRTRRARRAVFSHRTHRTRDRPTACSIYPTAHTTDIRALEAVENAYFLNFLIYFLQRFVWGIKSGGKKNVLQLLVCNIRDKVWEPADLR